MINAPSTSSPLFTRAEAIQYLRLDVAGVKDPSRSLDYYRKAGLIPGVRLGRCVFFRKTELDKFIETQMERVPV